MADMTPISVSETYAARTGRINDQAEAVAKGFDPAFVTVTNPLTNTLRFRSAAGKWEKWNGSAWVDAAATYAISISGNAATASAVAFSGVTGKPTTISGYGITDAITTGNIGSQSVSYASSAGAVPWSGVTSKPTTLAGYGITDATPVPDSTGNDNKVLRAGPAWGSAFTQLTAQALTSGTQKSWPIPSWVKRFKLVIHKMVMSGSAPTIQLGTSGGPVSSGYAGNIISITGSMSALTLSSYIYANTSAEQSGEVEFTHIDGNKWAFKGAVSRTASGSTDEWSGTIDLGASALTDVYMGSISGTATFTGGTANVQIG